uniref:Uncharacterized protein n=1 Tax=Caenorhabditis japonica TaxID=281687 RepID=A0A8R1E6K8_CAEJA
MVYMDQKPRGTAGTTVPPILCLMNWNDPACRQFKHYIPKFASNYDAPRHRGAAPAAPASYDYEEHEIADRSMNDDGVAEEQSGFFSPVFPAVTNAPPPNSRPSEPKTSTSSPSPTTTTTNKKMPSTTTLPVFFLTQISDGDVTDEEFDGSGDDLIGAGITAATQPSVTKSTTVLTPTPTTSAPASHSTVLPRPYASVKEAAEQNPDYLGSSIWNQVETLPEPMVTGPAWRTNKSIITTTTTTIKATTTTKKASTTTTARTTTSASRRAKTTTTPTIRYQPVNEFIRIPHYASATHKHMYAYIYLGRTPFCLSFIRFFLVTFVTSLSIRLLKKDGDGDQVMREPFH